VKVPSDDKNGVLRLKKRFVQRTKISFTVDDEGRTVGGCRLMAVF
jgi:S-methylmethionine-dependent homocysteine/selenocysteine methylase